MVSDVLDKVSKYLDARVRMIRLVQATRLMVTVYLPDRTARLLSDAEILDGGDVLPGFTLPIAGIFA